MSHLTNKERIKIEHWLNEGRNFQEIADSVEKARSTIVREVRKHRAVSREAGYNRIPNAVFSADNASSSMCVCAPVATANAAHVPCATSIALNFRKNAVQNLRSRRMFATDAGRRINVR